jgi:hypothetical protein
MRSQSSNGIVWKTLVVLAAILSCTLSQSALGQTSAKAFENPEQAAEALIQAAENYAENYNVPALLEILGPDSKEFISTADPVHDKSVAASFVAMAREKKWSASMRKTRVGLSSR